MLKSSSYIVVGVLMSCLTAVSQAQGVDTHWRLRLADLKHQVKVEATIRFADEPVTESCMGGTWKRIVVESKTAHDEKFFPLAKPLAYRLERGELTLGLTNVCDGYLFLTGKSEEANIHGIYTAASIGTSQKLGYFTLKRLQ